VRVTADTFEYEEWPSRKPSKKKIQRAALKADPIGTTSQVVAEAVKKSASRTVERETGRALRTVGTSAVVTAGATAARTAAAAAVPAVAAAAIVGGAIYAMQQIAKTLILSAGEAANRVSREYAAAQTATMKQFGVKEFSLVPAEIRTKLVNAYKRELANVYAFRPLPGTIRPSQQIPYGR
jgi:hypothetical protein